MIIIFKPPRVSDPHSYFLRYISKEKVYYKYYTLKQLLELPECKIDKHLFHNRIYADNKYFYIHNKHKYKDLWDILTRPLARNGKKDYSFDVNLWPAVNHEAIK